LDLLLAAAAIFRQQQPASRLRLIIPKTPPGFYKDLLQLIEKQGLNDYAQLLHELTFEQLKASLLASDCVVIPSYSEGFCFAAAEAAALGVPVISSGRMALKEVVSGRFINMKEVTPAALAEALELAANGHWQHRPLRKFELSDTVENYIMLYEAVLAGQPFYPKKAVV
jgi:glycosyltransferase involved in cell wall biosynthesis